MSHWQCLATASSACMNLRAVLGGALLALLAVDVQDAAILEGRRLALVKLVSVVSNCGCRVTGSLQQHARVDGCAGGRADQIHTHKHIHLFFFVCFVFCLVFPPVRGTRAHTHVCVCVCVCVYVCVCVCACVSVIPNGPPPRTSPPRNTCSRST